MSVLRALRAAGLALALAGCATTFDATTLGVPATMASPPPAQPNQPPRGERFTVSQSAVFAAWGIVTLKQASLENALASQLVGGKAVEDLKIKVRSKWSDVFVTAITLGLIVPRTVTYEGLVVGR